MSHSVSSAIFVNPLPDKDVGSGYMVSDEPNPSEHQAVRIPDSHCAALKTGSECRPPITYYSTTTLFQICLVLAENSIRC